MIMQLYVFSEAKQNIMTITIGGLSCRFILIDLKAFCSSLVPVKEITPTFQHQS